MKNGCAKGRCWIPIARPLPVVLLMLCCGGCLADHPKPIFSSGNSSSGNLSFGTSDFGLLDAFNYSCQPCRPHYLHVGQGGCGILFDCHSENGHSYFYDYSRLHFDSVFIGRVCCLHCFGHWPLVGLPQYLCKQFAQQGSKIHQ